jgi:3-oxoadipate enol-lactonase
MAFAESGEARVCYEVAGDGPRLLYISGSGGGMWPPPPVASVIQERFTAAALDRRGLGETVGPDGPWAMADYAADAAAVLDAAGWDSCRVLGISFGGMVAQELALRYPERVERLALVCTSSGGAGGASYPLIEFAGLPVEQQALRTLEVSDTRNDAAWQAEHADELRESVQALAARLPSDDAARANHRRLLEARAGLDTYDRLPSIAVPTLVAGGRYDGIAPPENQEALTKQIPGARLEMFDGGHGFFANEPEAMPAILDFLAEDV